MDNYTYLDVYAKTFLNEIKEKIRYNKIQLSGDKEKETDEYIVEVIKSLCIKPSHNLEAKEAYVLKVLPTDSKEDAERIFCSLMLYYVALYNDNIELLNKLLTHGYHFGYRRSALKLFTLDKRISSQFNIELYIELIKNQTAMFENFYRSLQDGRPVYRTHTPNNPVKELSTDEVIEKFASILKQNPNVVLSKERKTYYASNQYEINDLLTKYSINYFDEDTILTATEEQKLNIIRQAQSMSLTKQSLARLTSLMLSGNFSTDIYEYWNEVLEELSDYELIKINELDKDIFKDVALDIHYQIYENNKDIKDTPELFIQKVREALNKKIKSSTKEELVKASPKKRLLQRIKTK